MWCREANGLFCLGRICFPDLIFCRAITALDCDRRLLLSVWVYIYLELWKRVSKHFVISRNFPYLIACLLYCQLMSVCCCCCLVVGDLYRSGYKQNFANFYLPPPLLPSLPPTLVFLFFSFSLLKCTYNSFFSTVKWQFYLKSVRA